MCIERGRKVDKYQRENLEKLTTSTDTMKQLTIDNPNHFKTTRLGQSMTNYTNQLERDLVGKRRRNRTFPYGTLVYVDFGINFGSEFSAPHYAITLTKEDTKNKNTITVLPLTSKSGFSNYKLDESISKALAIVTAELGMIFSEEIQQRLLDELGTLIIEIGLTQSAEAKERAQVVQKQLENNKFLLAQSKKRLDKYLQDLDKTTFAKIDGITTIDKNKIFRRQNGLDPLGIVQVSQKQLQKISKEITRQLLLDNDGGKE